MSAPPDHTYFHFLGPHVGMTRALPAHLLTPGKWHYSRNMYFREGECFRSPLMTSDGVPLADDGANTTDITLITPFFTDSQQNLIMTFSGQGAYIVDFVGIGNVSLGFESPINNDTDNLYRWQAVLNRNKIYAVHPIIGVMQYDGTTPALLRRAITSGNNYSAKYVENFADHLVIANLNFDAEAMPLRIAYSDIGRFYDFQPSDVNEADFFDIEPSSFSLAGGLGITGLKRIGNACAIYTADSIWMMRYVGFDNGVMEFEEYLQGVGAWLPYSLVGTAQYHVFISRDNIYRFDGASVQPVGDEIRRWFFDNLTSDPVKRNKTWGYVNFPRQTITWYFITKSNLGDDVDAGIVWNYRENTWTTVDGRNRTAVLAYPAQTYSKWTDQLEGTTDALVGTTDSLTTTVNLDFDLFAVGFQFRRELRASDLINEATSVLMTGETNPTLETGDIWFEELSYIKEIHAIGIHCLTRLPQSNINENLTAEIRVYVAVRDNLPYEQYNPYSEESDLLVFNYIGSYTNDPAAGGAGPAPPNAQSELDSMAHNNQETYVNDRQRTRGIALAKPLRGRVFRFKFEFINCNAQFFKGFTLQVYNTKNAEG